MAKKQKNSINYTTNSELSTDARKVIIIVACVAVLLIAMYFLTTRILEKQNNDTAFTELPIQYDQILAGSSFNQQQEEYLVIYYDASDEYSSLPSLVSSYQSGDHDIKLYSVDLSDVMNAKYLTEGDVVTDSPSSLRVKDPTVLRFRNQEVSEVITDMNEITSLLSE